MLKIFPWDIWAAAALAIGVVLAAVFEPAPISVFVVIYLGLCAYIVVETFTGELQ